MFKNESMTAKWERPWQGDVSLTLQVLIGA